jgi:hypothetical protein
MELKDHNVGSLERIIRFGVGALLFLLVIGKASSLPTWAFVILLIASLGLILTALFGICPIYSVLGINTCEECRKMEQKAKEEQEHHMKDEKPLVEEKMEVKEMPKAKKEKKKGKTKKAKRRK